MIIHKKIQILLMVLFVFSSLCTLGEAQITTFTYQGRLGDTGTPANGFYDIEFAIYDDPITGTQQGSTMFEDDVDVVDGYFTVKLDPGVVVFDGTQRWIEIKVRPGASSNPDDYVTLDPRVEITPAPTATNADLLSGFQAADFSLSGHNHDADYVNVSGDTMSGDLTVNGRIEVGSSSLSLGTLQVRTQTAGSNPIIVTSSDDELLHIFGESASGDGYFSIRNDLSADGVSLNSAGNSYFMGGNVGIGTTSPQEMLDVNGQTRTSSLQITGGSDLAEPFTITEQESVMPGMVLIIDQDRPGQLKISDRAYDHRVAGIVSGAHGLNTGIVMSQEGVAEKGSLPVALNGRVYCLADASTGSINPGDLLTTSDIPGHAMKVADFNQAQGAIIGKAMTYLEKGRGLVLVLVSLQ